MEALASEHGQFRAVLEAALKAGKKQKKRSRKGVEKDQKRRNKEAAKEQKRSKKGTEREQKRRRKGAEKEKKGSRKGAAKEQGAGVADPFQELLGTDSRPGVDREFHFADLLVNLLVEEWVW